MNNKDHLVGRLTTHGLEYGRGVIVNEKCLGTGKRKSFVVQKRYGQGGTNDLFDVEIVVSRVIQIEPSFMCDF